MKPNWKTLGAAAGTVAALLLTSAIVVFSQQPQGPPRPPRGPMGPDFHGGPGGPGGPREFGPFGPLGRDLNLTDDQKAQIQKIQQSFRESNKALFDQLRTLHEQQGDPFSANLDEAAVRAAAEARAKIQVELDVAHARMMSQILGVLTTEQKALLQQHRDEMKRTGPPPPPAPPRQPGEAPEPQF